MYSISFIGAGNMAFRLSLALLEAGHTIDFIYDRTPKNGQKLVKALSANGSSTRYTDSLIDILPSEVIIIAVSDDAISQVVEELANAFPLADKLYSPTVLHTSGATSISELSPLSIEWCEYGVLYPLMTLSKGKNIDFSEVPFLLESNAPKAEKILTDLAVSLKAEYLFCDSEKRLRMHCAAVFSCNFVNYILSLAYEVAGDKATFLIPSTIEGVRKAFMINPDQMQTGPALRGDVKTMEKHIKLLQSLNLPEEEEIYKIISKQIPGRVKKKKIDMSNYKTKLHQIKAFAYDVDGVLTDGSFVSMPDGDLIRIFNAKDGFGMRMANLNGYPQAIITGGVSESIVRRFDHIGIPAEDIYQRSRMKLPDFQAFCEKHSLKPEEVAFVGDDIPDIIILQNCGLAVCPSDAVAEVKEVCDFVSLYPGGHGCVRDLIEQVLKVQGKWIFNCKAYSE